MTTKAEHRVRLTPAFKRIAYYYLSLGAGEYHPDHPHYDRIVVRPLYDFEENPRVKNEYAGGMVVEFFRGTHRFKWVEFRCQVVGGGGEPILREISL